MKIDYIEYVIIHIKGKILNNQKFNYKSILINETNLLFIPYDELKNVQEKYKIISISWQIMYPVLLRLLEEDWDYVFENDEDSHQLEVINEEFNDPVERLTKIREYFEEKYKWPDRIADPILHTRLIITPPNSSTHFVFYYGETVNLQNNSEENICHLFELILEEYKKLEPKSDFMEEAV